MSFHQEQIDGLRSELEGAERDNANPDLVQRARINLGMAQRLIDEGRVHNGRAANMDQKHLRFGWFAHLEAAYYALQMARGQEPMLEGLAFLGRQSTWGTLGSQKRWDGGARDVVHLLIDRLKNEARYCEWRAREKWDELISLMNDARVGEDREPLNPSENWIEGDADQSTISYSGDNGTPLTYKTFKNRLSS